MKALKKKIKFEIPLVLKSGLHVGGSNLSMAIGGADAVVIRDALTQQPIIPGSSIKGKMRSLTEKLLGAYQEVNMGQVKFGPYHLTTDAVKKIVPMLYGRIDNREENIPSRILVRDAKLTEESAKELGASENTDMLYSEVKTEVVIDRVTSAAMPRQIERVPAGAVFTVELILNIFDGDDEKKLVDYVKVGLRLMEDDYLGGKGSRGSGDIELNWDAMTVTQKTQDDYEKDNVWKPHTVSS